MATNPLTTRDELGHRPLDTAGEPDGLEPRELYRIGVVGCDASLAVDPVCGRRMPSTGEHAIGLRCADDQWWFCGMPCVASFATHRRAAS